MNNFGIDVSFFLKNETSHTQTIQKSSASPIKKSSALSIQKSSSNNRKSQKNAIQFEKTTRTELFQRIAKIPYTLVEIGVSEYITDVERTVNFKGYETEGVYLSTEVMRDCSQDIIGALSEKKLRNVKLTKEGSISRAANDRGVVWIVFYAKNVRESSSDESSDDELPKTSKKKKTGNCYY